jgi:hypothetical protein
MTIFKYFEEFPDVPKSIIVKTELLRQGVRFSQNALDAFKDLDTVFKGYFLFSYDRGKMVTFGEKIPDYSFLRKDDTPIQIRTYEFTPYVIDVRDTKFYITENNDFIEEIYFYPAPKFYSQKLEDGTPMRSIVDCPGKDTLFVTLNKYCEMFKHNLQCQFCDFVPTTAGQSKSGEKIVVHKNSEQVAEALAVALKEIRFRHLYFTGGTILSQFQGKTEVEYYCDHLNATRKRLRVWYPANFQIGALKEDDWKRIYDTGVGFVQPNIEVWDRRLFEIICPGKNKLVGYDEWIKRTIKAVEIFGPGRVQPNFVIGVEMSKPNGFVDVDQAVKSILGGFDFLMGHGVLPRMATWCIEPNAVLGPQDLPPLEYFLKVGKGYTELRRKHGLDLPGGLSRESYGIDCLYDWDYYY